MDIAINWSSQQTISNIQHDLGSGSTSHLPVPPPPPPVAHESLLLPPTSSQVAQPAPPPPSQATQPAPSIPGPENIPTENSQSAGDFGPNSNAVVLYQHHTTPELPPPHLPGSWGDYQQRSTTPDPQPGPSFAARSPQHSSAAQPSRNTGETQDSRNPDEPSRGTTPRPQSPHDPTPTASNAAEPPHGRANNGKRPMYASDRSSARSETPRQTRQEQVWCPP